LVAAFDLYRCALVSTGEILQIEILVVVHEQERSQAGGVVGILAERIQATCCILHIFLLLLMTDEGFLAITVMKGHVGCAANDGEKNDR
jgi:hypothetical protein